MKKGREGDEAQAPLLAPRLLVEGCPGCLLEQRKAAAHGAPPKKELSIVALISLANALPIASLFPFIYFMVRDFGIAKSVTKIGSYAGYIGSALMLGRFMTSTFWGMVADKYGRKLVILIGTTSIIILNTGFGFSTNFWVALTTRFLLGVCNGMLGPTRAYASEICSKENQAWGLSMVGTMWGLGFVIGPAIGGYLAQPSTQYPTLFPSGSLFDRFPYALPCICISAFSVPALIAGFWIPESLHNHQTMVIANEEEAKEDESNTSADPENGITETALVKLPRRQLQAEKKVCWSNLGMLAAMYIFCVWGLHSMAYSEVFSLWAVSPKTYGGLGFTTSQVGNIFSLTGVSLLVFQLFGIARLIKIFGARRMTQVPAVLTIMLTVMYPLIAKLSGTTLWIVLIAVSCVKNLFSVGGTTCGRGEPNEEMMGCFLEDPGRESFLHLKENHLACVDVGSSILVNNSVMSRQRGVANGISTSIMSLFKAVAPATAGIVFSWSQSRMDASFLPGMWMVFSLICLFAAIALIPAFEPILPHSLDHPPLEAAFESASDT